MLVQLIAPLVLLVSKVLLLAKLVRPRLAVFALLARIVLLALLLALSALMVTFPLLQDLLLAPHAPLPLREMAPARVPQLALSAMLVMLPLVVAPPAFAARKAPGLPMMPQSANSALPVRLV
jgi:hypothetical protein